MVNKFIKVQWIIDPNNQYGQEMRVRESDHPRFTVGYRFDWGFAGIVGDEGYILEILPAKENLPKNYVRENKIKRIFKKQK